MGWVSTWFNSGNLFDLPIALSARLRICLLYPLQRGGELLKKGGSLVCHKTASDDESIVLKLCVKYPSIATTSRPTQIGEVVSVWSFIYKSNRSVSKLFGFNKTACKEKLIRNDTKMLIWTYNERDSLTSWHEITQDDLICQSICWGVSPTDGLAIMWHIPAKLSSAQSRRAVNKNGNIHDYVKLRRGSSQLSFMYVLFYFNIFLITRFRVVVSFEAPLDHNTIKQW